MTIREQTEEWERVALAPYAALAADARGRDRMEPDCPIRTAYQRDRDRIIHCNAFRRLMHKTQVFINPEGDHYRTRLTHTLEVSQIARTIARALRLNEDLTEAVAMGHDLGHTPFGHAGEKGLDEMSPVGYRHFEQSVRVAECLEKGGEGLNLTWEVRDGILCHSAGSPEQEAATREGRVVHYADKIAYMNHDIDDAIRARIISEEDLPFRVKCILGRSKSERITALVTSLVENSGETVQMAPDVLDAYQELRDFMFAEVYKSPAVKREEQKAVDLVKRLYEYFAADGERLPEDYRKISREEGIDRAVCDYISGMSDRYAIDTYESLFIPRSWTRYTVREPEEAARD